MGGCAVLLFSKHRMLNRIKELYVCKVKVGQGGFAKNKGSVAIRFKVDQTTFAFLNCHLEAGEGQVYKRVEMLSAIMEKAFLTKIGFQQTHNMVVFVFGDLNFRVSLDFAKAKEAARTG